MPSSKNKIPVSKFVDVTIYRRIEDNYFVSLTDMEFRDLSSKSTLTFFEINDIEPIYKYCISVFTSTRIKYVAGGELQNIIDLAGIKNAAFIRQMQTGLDDEAGEDEIAKLCAKKIMSYPYGKCVQELRDNSGKIYIDFYRTNFVDKKRTFPVVFSKAFEVIPIIEREVSVWKALKSMQQPRNGFAIVR